MIKFFRNIRKSLLKEGKTSSYFRYAIGEILLVMVGILLALQVNTWNQNRINSTKERAYLIGIESDLKSQLVLMENTDNVYDSLLSNASSLLIDFQELNSVEKIPNLNKRISYLMWDTSLREINTSFTELISTGNINLIKNKSLRTLIIKYYQYSEMSNNTTNTNTKNVFYGSVFPILTDIAIINPSDFDMKIEGITQYNFSESLVREQQLQLKNPTVQKKLIKAISLKIVGTTSNKRSVNSTIDGAKILLEEIQKELKK